MEEVLFKEAMEGITIERVVREQEFSMSMNHFHDTYELYFLLEGERYYFIDRETYHVKAGDVVLVNRQQIHKTSQAESQKHDRILLQLGGPALEGWLKAVGLYPLERLFGEYYGVTRPSEQEWEELVGLLLGMKEELAHCRERYETMVKIKLSQILLLVYRSRRKAILRDSFSVVQTAKHGKVHEVAEYLTCHCETNEDLKELAKRFYISKSYLSRIFREVTGFSVNEYRNLARIRKARELLVGSCFSVTEISEVLGFESVTYFERVFKKHTDQTPLRFRKEAKTTEALKLLTNQRQGFMI